VNEPPLILASTSPRRRELLAARGVRFVVEAPEVDEDDDQGSAPDDLAEALARRKARAVAARRDRGYVVGADTVVALGGVSLGKPRDDADARRILGLLAGTTHRVVTGYCVVDAATGRERSGRATTSVTMRAMTAAEIAAYVASGESEGKAGAYAIQETGDRFVTRLEGGFDNVVGLPVEAVLAAAAALIFGGDAP
jgi:septum formation protein